MAKTRNPADATLRNVRAAKARNTTLTARLDALEARIEAIERLPATLRDALVVKGKEYAARLGRR